MAANYGRLVTLVGGIIGVALIALGWFVILSPLLDRVGELDAQRAQIEAQNEVERATLAEMKAQYENLDELVAELEELRVSVPGDQDLRAFFDHVAEAAGEAGVVLNGVSVEGALPFVAAVAEGGAPPPAEETTDETTEEEPVGSVIAAGDLGPPPLATTALISNLYVLPISMSITADVKEATAFLKILQGLDGRLFLIDGVSMTFGSSLTGELTGYIFVVHDPSQGPVGALPEPALPEEIDPAVEPTATPEPTTTPGEDATPTPTPTP
jgi:multidrug efflux pump subunit AcrA (membrane-fusion protein)